MKNEVKYTLSDVINAISVLKDEEKSVISRRATVANLLETVNDKDEYDTILNAIDDGIEEWKVLKSSIKNLNSELSRLESERVYKYANVNIFNGVDGYTFARLANVVSNVTHKSLDICCHSVWEILNRVDLLKNGAPDTLKDKSIAEFFGVDLNKTLFWTLSDTHSKWETYSIVEKTAITKVFGGDREQESFIVLMENWDKVDNHVSSVDIKTMLDLVKSRGNNGLSGLKETMVALNDKWTDMARKKEEIESTHESSKEGQKDEIVKAMVDDSIGFVKIMTELSHYGI